MLFSLEALNAKEGDALLLHYGDSADPQLIVIDGGPPGVFNQTMKDRFREIADLRGIALPVPANLVMVSHIDSDHIAGVIDLFKHFQAAANPVVRPRALWHNSFNDVLDDVQIASVADLAGLDADHAAAAGMDHWLSAFAAGVGQGRKLRDLAAALAIHVNAGTSLAGFVSDQDNEVDFGNGLKMTILGPTKELLQGLEQKWRDELAAAAAASVAERRARIAAFLDRSAANLSSIVALVKSGTKTMLLTGDARGDHVLEGLRKAGLMNAQDRCSVDLLKVPHHGSDRNVSTDFFRKVRAKHYVFSANGKHHNPDTATLEMLTAARGASRYTMYFTNRVADVDAFLDSDQRDHNRNYDVVYRDDDYFSVWVDLGDDLTF